MKQKTAVDWLFDKIKSHFEHDGDLFETLTYTIAIAKQKEKEQVITAWMDGEGYSDEYSQKEAEHYYNLVYGGEQ